MATPQDPARDLAEFQRLLKIALKKILWVYIDVPVAGQEEEVARERLFCYELYHQLRVACDEAGFEYWLGGELDKRRHPIIRGDFIPDLVVHEPGDMHHNLCVIEVKPIDGSDKGFVNDIEKLTCFVREYRYHHGLFLVYGPAKDPSAIVARKAHCRLEALRDLGISVLWMKHAQAEPEFLN